MSKVSDFLNHEVSTITKSRNKKVGDLFGIELECEGVRVNDDGSVGLFDDWVPHADGSLRNNHGESCEWVFNGPANYKKSLKRINKLFDFFENRKSQLICSNRTSTHIHFNMGDKSVYQLVNVFILYTILEGILDKYCGEDRDGNLFCLNTRHAEDIVRIMARSCFDYQNFLDFHQENRYCSLNISSVHRFNTVEFRAMRGLDNREDVSDWLKIVNEFCQYACYGMTNPVNLIQDMSMKGCVALLNDIFSKESCDKLMAGWSRADISESMYEGMALVQVLSQRIGSEFKNVIIRGQDYWAGLNDIEVVKDIEPENVRPKKRRMIPEEGIILLDRGVLHDPFRIIPGAHRGDAQVRDILNALRVREADGV